ncbi:MAG: hypothetical protein LC754_16350 [Acidobacteria bacterium]|nr:hypothetical protein [Acidobacteriota bacterium]
MMRKALILCAISLIGLAAAIFPATGVRVLAGDPAIEPAQRRDVAPVRWQENFEIEVLVGGRPLEEIFGRGRRYVLASEGAEYELRIRNPLPVRVGVALSVDGLNSIDARRSASWDASKWVIEPYQTIHITGWQMSSERARKFYFTTERDSYAARLGRKTDLGVISAVFYREVAPIPVPVTPPPYMRDGERRERSESGREMDKSSRPPAQAGSAGQSANATGVAPRRDDEYAATGIGRAVENRVYWVNLQLERRPAAEVTIRYEYADALYKLGLLPRPRPSGEDPLRRRERARGFEDSRFCPEP